MWDSGRWPNFSPAEMACRGDGQLVIVPDFMDRLQALRDAFGKPLVVTSAYRSPEYNATVSSTGRKGPHTTGRAVDIAISGDDALKLIRMATHLGFTGFGIKQKGSGRFVHLDDLLDAPGQPRPWIWSY